MCHRFAETIEAIRRTIAADTPAAAKLRQVMQIIHNRHPQYKWVGIYLLRDDILELGPFVGAPTEHTRIPVGTGVCGTAVAQGENQIVEDVRQRENYLACSPDVRSEIVVLIWDGEQILGQIDADSDEVAAFGSTDEAFLVKVASILAPAVAELRKD